ncbi:hypothetical protein KBY97_14250 [Synechococcus sp. ATX 2A4]|uniref:hypothetical protein n=1 Tax=Synechococcus sp. ATX 2A4 TaxID=2823727 RepID=UPI0020CB9EE7|nr:hypothetical protein [Synechococcus sp. ATX 2A4]MCP9886273.1 hypothetical protein [Synechococcus sp. ATX 2A4]
MKLLQLAAVSCASAVVLSNPILVLSYEGEKPPAGSKNASCRYGDNAPGFCKVKILSETPGKLQIWRPAGVQSAIILTYTGRCLKQGCVLTGDDFGYVVGPARYEVLNASMSVIRMKELSGNKAIEEIRILER